MVIPKIVRRESIFLCLGGVPSDYWGNEKNLRRCRLPWYCPKCYRSKGEGELWNVLFFDVWGSKVESSRASFDKVT